MSRSPFRSGHLSSSQRRRERSRGQGLVEFALVAPIFFLLIFLTIEAGRFIFYYQTLNHATREGARYAIIHGANAPDGCPSGPLPANSTPPSCYDPNGDNVRAAVQGATFNMVSLADLDIPDPTYYGPNGATNARGSYVTVYVSYTYAPVLPLIPDITISTESTLVVNN